MAEVTRVAPDGTHFSLTTEWIRITQNPVCPDRYPKIGQTVELKGHKLMPDGKYLVTLVEEFEPPFHKGEDGRDIRISVYPLSSGIGHGLNGESFIKAMQWMR